MNVERISSRLSVAISLLLMFPMNLAICQDGKSETGDAVTRFLAKMTAEREKLVIFKYECELSNGASLKPAGVELAFSSVFPNKLKIVYEYSKLDDHEMIVLDFSNCDTVDDKRVQWIGCSQGLRISGRSSTDTQAGQCVVNKLRQEERAELFRFAQFVDYRLLGLSFCGDLLLRDRFAPVVKNLKNQSYSSKMTVRENTDGFQVLRSPGDFIIKFDEDKGFWPIESELAFADWKINVEEVKGHFLPIEFWLSCKSDKPNQLLNIDGKIKWSIVNEPMPVGLDRAKEIAKEYSVVLVESSE